MAAPRRWSRVNMLPLGDNLADTVDKSQGADHDTSEPTDTTPAESSPGTSVVPSSSLFTPSPAALFPIARVQKLEAKMATLLHYIQPWMQKSITEAEDRIENKVAQ